MKERHELRVLAVRFPVGILLGAGGLARAYQT